MGLLQLNIANVIGHLASSVPTSAQFKSPWGGILVYANGFTRDAIHERGKHPLDFPVRFSWKNI